MNGTNSMFLTVRFNVSIKTFNYNLKRKLINALIFNYREGIRSRHWYQRSVHNSFSSIFLAVGHIIFFVSLYS
jgi:hypothetical protein